MKNLFESKMFDKDASLILEYQQDLREECSKCGDVKKVIIYDVSIRCIIHKGDYSVKIFAFTHVIQS